MEPIGRIIFRAAMVYATRRVFEELSKPSEQRKKINLEPVGNFIVDTCTGIKNKFKKDKHSSEQILQFEKKNNNKINEILEDIMV